MKYYLCTDFTPYDEKKILTSMAHMPTGQRERVKRVKYFQGRREKVIAWLMLVHALREMGIKDTPQIAYAIEGKPYLENHPDIHFNISHCRTAIAVAINKDYPIGIDVESRRKISNALIQKVCNENEQNQIANSPDPVLEFIKIWTRKEAYYKCTGTGLQDNLHETENLIQQAHLKIETLPLPAGDGYISICY